MQFQGGYRSLFVKKAGQRLILVKFAGAIFIKSVLPPITKTYKQLIMKKIFLPFLLLTISALTQAQILPTANSPEYKNILKMSASLFVRNTFQMGYEKFFDPTTSIFVATGFNFKDNDYESDWGIRTEVQMRFYVYTVINPDHSHRLYFAPYLMNHYIYLQSMDNSYGAGSVWQHDSFDALGGGMLFGWSYSFANRINLDLYAGGGLRKTFNYEGTVNYDGVFDYSYSGIIPRLGIDIGFWF